MKVSEFELVSRPSKEESREKLFASEYFILKENDILLSSCASRLRQNLIVRLFMVYLCLLHWRRMIDD